MESTAKQKHELWLKSVKDKKLLRQLKRMDKKQIETAFAGPLSFGTAGIRSIMAAGESNINIYTINQAVRGYIRWLKKKAGDKGELAVVICYDTRINSKLFAENAAVFFANAGIKAYFFSDVMPTPFCSFAIKHLKADGGFMFTSSHNTKEYNGYKVYKNTGCQILEEDAREIEKEIHSANMSSIFIRRFDYFVTTGMIVFSDEILKDYLNEVKKIQINKIENISICYSALNGCGYKIVPEYFNQISSIKFVTVKKQCVKSGKFKTCPAPNPEKAPALELSLKTAKENDCELLLATDPDADRLGIMVKHEDKYVQLTGNETGILFIDYLITELKKARRLPAKPIVIKSVVTTPYIEVLAKRLGFRVFNTLTGFPSLGNKIEELAKKGESNNILLVFEEAIGFIMGNYTRDKDGICAAIMVAEMASHYKKQNKTLVGRLNEIYKEYGNSKSYSIIKKYEGAEGAQKIKNLMENYRLASPEKIAGLKVIKKLDYMTGVEDIPKANIIEFNLQENARIIVRPSGTEPLIKFYITLSKNTEKYQEILKWTNL